LISQLLFISIGEVILRLNNYSILYKSLVFLIEDGRIDFNFVEAQLIIFCTLTLLLAMLFLLFVIREIYLGLRQHSKPVVNKSLMHRRHCKTRVFSIEQDWYE